MYVCVALTVKSRELRATDVRAFIKNRVGKIRRQVLLKENNRRARIMAGLRATGVLFPSPSFSVSFFLFLSLVHEISSGNDERSEKYCVNSPIASRRVATWRVASPRLVPFRVRQIPRTTCRCELRLYSPIVVIYTVRSMK